MTTKRKHNAILTVEQIQGDVITQLSNQYWAPFSNVKRLPFDAKVIEDIYFNELIKTNYSTKRIMLLEFSQYLENYLWPNFSQKSSRAHVMSIIVMINEKHRERIPAWNCFKSDPEKFGQLFDKAMDLSLEGQNHDLRFNDLSVSILFFIHAFNSMGNDLVRGQVMKLVSPLIWHNVLPAKRDEEFNRNPLYKKAWKKLNTIYDKASEEEKKMTRKSYNFLSNHLDRFLNVVGQVKMVGDLKKGLNCYCERMVEWLIDLQAQLHSRRFLNLVLQSKHVIVKCFSSSLYSREVEGKLFRELLDRLEFYCRFEINDQSGEALSEREVMVNRCDKMSHLQMVIFKNFPDLKHLALTSANISQTREQIKKDLSELPSDKLQFLLSELHLLPPLAVANGDGEVKSMFETDFMMKVLMREIEEYPSQLAALNLMPLYPTEDIIWNENIVPMENPNGSDGRQSESGGLALPKLNLQFLTIHDYLLRNFNLFRLESTYEVRQDIEDAVYRMKPWLSTDGSCHFGGWARMAHAIEGFTVFEVGAPNVGENKPSRVRADLTIDLKAKSNVRNEWMSLRKHDVIFLLTIRPVFQVGTLFDYNQPFVPQVGLVYVRGCEIEGMLDDHGKVIEEGIDVNPDLTGTKRTFRVFLDSNQYKTDLMNINQGKEDLYQTFNLVIRRKPKENNFKAVLETIRDLMNIHCVVPEWIINILLGLGDPDSAHYSQLPTTISSMDWKDTFLDFTHLKASFPHHEVTYVGLEQINSIEEAAGDKNDKDLKQVNPSPPYKLTFAKVKNKDTDKITDTILAKNYKHLNRGPYKFNQPKTNQIKFTPTQIEAIKSGMQPGLTMVVGPPGTGKTDVAVQIISNIYHNFPEQRTLIVTHSNQALNQLFEKIMALDVEERHLLRLGHGEDDLDTENDYSRYGRVNYVLDQRISLLEQVNKLHISLGLSLENQFTCELAGYFYVNEILKRFEDFNTVIEEKDENETPKDEIVSKYFPFKKFFDDCPDELFCNKYEKDLDTAQGCFRYISKIFKQLEEFRPFELLRNGRDRAKYLLIKEAKILAMTCTHAALKRRDLVESLFQYDNILMEESAQILEIETFIPLLLQNPDHGYNRLKRWIMIGDHHQLPPVIKNMAFQKFSNMEQSLFTRFVRLGVPIVELDAQGRSRPSICNLYNWRYRNLGNLPHLYQLTEYLHANPGLFFDYQFIDVQDYNGVGESEPNPYFYQNLAEAEYVGGFFTYLRLIGYPPERITILTTYNGQKHLIRDVIEQRCASNRLIGKPLKITTVDRYQGQQNDIVILSLVRTKNVGHLRDVRRLVVAMSRARLGLYIFGRASLFQNCFELTPTFSQLLRRPLKLHLAPSEKYDVSFSRKSEEPPKEPPLVIDNMPHMTQYVYDLYKQKVHVITEAYNKEMKEREKKIEEMKLQEMARKQEEENERLRKEEEQRASELISEKEKELRDAELKRQALRESNEMPPIQETLDKSELKTSTTTHQNQKLNEEYQGDSSDEDSGESKEIEDNDKSENEDEPKAKRSKQDE